MATSLSKDTLLVKLLWISDHYFWCEVANRQTHKQTNISLAGVIISRVLQSYWQSPGTSTLTTHNVNIGTNSWEPSLRVSRQLNYKDKLVHRMPYIAIQRVSLIHGWLHWLLCQSSNVRSSHQRGVVSDWSVNRTVPSVSVRRLHTRTDLQFPRSFPSTD